MKKQLNNLKAHYNKISTRLHAKLISAIYSDRGDSNMLSIIFISVVVIMVISLVFWPQLRSFVEGAFTRADSKLDSIWNAS